MPRILVVTAGLERSSRLLEYALASYPDAAFTVLDVIDPRTRPTEYLEGADALQWVTRRRGAAADVHEAAAELGRQHDVSVSSEVAYGPTSRVVLEWIGRESVDQLVIGRGDRSDGHRIRQRAVERLVRRTTVPTTVVRPSADATTAAPPESVLVAVDGSQQATAALEHACETFPEATITAIHVTDVLPWLVSDVEPPELNEVDSWNEAALEEWRSDTTEKADALLETARERAAALDVDLRTVTGAGLPVREILSYVDAEGIDHVYVGRTGRTDRKLVERILIGSTTEDVLDGCRVPVTVVP